MMQVGPGPGAGVGTLVVVLIWLTVWGGVLAAWIIFLVAVWRGMKAHESIADSLRRIADNRERFGGPEQS